MQKTMKATIVEGGVRGWVTHPQTASGTSAQCCRSAGQTGWHSARTEFLRSGGQRLPSPWESTPGCAEINFSP
jgi:hypothetical protein